MNKKLQVLKYLIFDFIAALLAWVLFFLYRKFMIENSNFDIDTIIFNDYNFIFGLIFIPLFWIGFYFSIGTYRNIYRKARLGELGQTLLISFLGVLFIFFILLLDDIVNSYKEYYKLFFVLFSLHFVLTYFFRFIITSATIKKIRKRIIGFNTIIIGNDKKALKLYQQIESQSFSVGNKFIGFVSVKNNEKHILDDFIPNLVTYENILDIISKYNIEEVIIAVENNEQKKIPKILTELYQTNVLVKTIPDLYHFFLGSVKMTTIFGTPLIMISPDLMPAWQQSLKRLIDIFASIVALIILSPVYLITAFLVRMSSKGPIFYSHERIGIHGVPFVMHKFRSMYTDAEKNGPALSSKNDSRITPWGKVMRKYRLDELPQFYNVLIGKMSLVGPRPERQYFMEQIVQRAPYYKLLHKVKPGITSWGQVKYGYAENVDQMIERLQYDLLYLENMSIAVDLKILIYTVLIVVQGRGK